MEVVGDDRTEVIGTGMDVVNTAEDEDSGTESDVAIGIGVVAATEVVGVTPNEESNTEVDNEMKVVETVDSEIEVSVFVGDDRRKVVRTGMKVVNTAEDEDSKIESEVLLGIGVVVGTDVVEVTLDENCDMELEAVVIVKTEGSKMGVRAVVGEGEIEVVITGMEIVNSEIEVNMVVGDDKTEVVSTGMEVVDSEIEISVGNEVVGTGLEVINTTEDEDSGTESDVTIDMGVVVGAEVDKVTLDEDSDMDVNIEIKVVGIMETVDSKMGV